MGQSPGIPENLSEEGKDFLRTCFVHQPYERASAQDLLSHNFTKVGHWVFGSLINFLLFQIFEEDENPVLPMFSLISNSSENYTEPA